MAYLQHEARKGREPHRSVKKLAEVAADRAIDYSDNAIERLTVKFANKRRALPETVQPRGLAIDLIQLVALGEIEQVLAHLGIDFDWYD